MKTEIVSPELHDKAELAIEFIEALHRLRDRCITPEGLRIAAERVARQRLESKRRPLPF